MVRKTVVEITDDLDGTPGAEMVSFGLDGQRYEIDLSGEHADSLRAILAGYIAAGRPAYVPGGRRKPGRPTRPRGPVQAPAKPGRTLTGRARLRAIRD